MAEQYDRLKEAARIASSLPFSIVEVMDAMKRLEMQYDLKPKETETVQPSTFYDLLDKMRDTHDTKAADYAPDEDRFANLRMCEKMGISAFEGVVVRMGDKMSRIMNLISRSRAGQGASVSDESIQDTLMDLAVYSLIAIQLKGEEE